MLQNRRVYDITDSILNYAFLAFLFLFAIFAVSFWMSLESEFLLMLVIITNVVAWTIIVASLILLVHGCVIRIGDNTFKGLRLVWCVLRILLCCVVCVAMDFFSILVNEGLSLTL